MIRGLYTAASGMMSSLVANDTLANNLANISTTGYKRNQVSFQTFPQMLINNISKQDETGNASIGEISTGSRVRESRIDFSQGPLVETGNTFDMAINGAGFFTIQSPTDNKTYYTRAGNFTINQDGYLITNNGDFVMGKLGRINLKQVQPPYQTNSKGEISGNGQTVDQVLITRFENVNTLKKAGETRFEADPATSKILPNPNVAAPVPYEIATGALERSNTNAIGELVNSITGMRLYEALQKNIHMQNETLQKAVNDVGRYK